jgi:putative SOS response-associated peptidase YedK
MDQRTLRDALHEHRVQGVRQEASLPRDRDRLWEKSFAILTAPASPTLERIHDRMPLVMHPANYAAWLDPNTESPADLMQPFDDGRLQAYPVSTFVNDPKNDAPAAVERSG